MTRKLIGIFSFLALVLLVWGSPSSVLSEPLGYTLTLLSSPDSGVTLTPNVLDNDASGDGTTPFIRNYYDGTTVNIAAPATFNGQPFIKWELDDVDYPITPFQKTINDLLTPNINVDMYSDHTVIAVYQQAQDTTPPQLVSNLEVENGNQQITLLWTNPSDADYAYTIVMRRSDRYPTQQYDGDTIYVGNNTTVVDTGLENRTTYYYGIFTVDTASNYSLGVYTTAIPGTLSFQVKSLPAAGVIIGSSTHGAHTTDFTLDVFHGDTINLNAPSNSGNLIFDYWSLPGPVQVYFNEVTLMVNSTAPLTATAQYHWVLSASFYANPSSGYIPLDVNFYSTVTGTQPIRYAWDFGDGGTSTTANPTYSYQSIGNYDVQLIVTDNYSTVTVSEPGLITVSGIPPAGDFSAVTTVGYMPLATQFIAAMTAGSSDSISWDFGDTFTGSGDTVTHTYATTGNYSVQMIATNAYGAITVTKENYIKVYGPSPLLFSTYLGGNGDDQISGIYVSPEGNIYVTGGTNSQNFPVDATSFDSTNSGGYDAFIAGFQSDGSTLIFSTYLGGNNDDFACGITGDTTGIYITGYSYSPDFPVTPGVFGNQNMANYPFITKFDLQGQHLIYSTFALADRSYNVSYLNAGIAVDQSGNAYITGVSDLGNIDIPANAYAPNPHGGVESYLIVMNQDGSDLKYATYIGGSGDDIATGITVDANGYAYIVGYTNSPDFMQTGGTDTSYNVFVCKINPWDSDPTLQLFYVNKWGGENDDYGTGIKVDTNGNAYVTGYTNSTAYPVTANAYATHKTGIYDAFVTKLNVSGTQIVYSTYIGGKGTNEANGIAIDSNGNAYLTGYTDSTDFPVTPGSYSTTYHYNADTTKSGDAFVLKLDPSGRHIIYSSFLGGSDKDIAHTIAVDTQGNAYIAGVTKSTDFPVSPQAFSAVNSGGKDAFITKLALTSIPSTPIADFYGTPTTGNVSLTVQFIDRSFGNASSWMWDFGDGSISTTQDPVHIYQSMGTFTVQLIVENPWGSSTVIKPDYIQAFGHAPIIDFYGDTTSGIVPLTVHFYSTASVWNATIWNWNFGEGTTETFTNSSATHIYQQPGTYTVTLVGSNEFGTTTVIKQDYIIVQLPVLTADFYGTPTTGAAPLQVQFYSSITGTPVSYSWDFGDEGTSTTANPAYTYLNVGTYNVKLIVSDQYQSVTVNKSQYINVYGLPPFASFTASPTSGILPLAVNFYSSSSVWIAGSWQWDFGDGNKTQSTTQNISHIYQNPGFYTVTLVAGNIYGTSTIIKQQYIAVNPPPLIVDFFAIPTTGLAPMTNVHFFSRVTSGNPQQYAWFFGDGSTSSAQDPVHTYTSAGSYNVVLWVVGMYTTVYVEKDNYIVATSKPPVVSFIATPTTGYAPLTVYFNDTSSNNPNNWYWDFGDGQTLWSVNNPSHTYASTGRYTITLYASNPYGTGSVVRMNYIQVTKAPVPLANFYATPTSGNVPLQVQFYDTSTGGVNQWQWDFGDGSFDTTQNPVHKYMQSGIFTVKQVASSLYGSSTASKVSYITVWGGSGGPMTNVTKVNAIPSYGGIKFYWQNPVRRDYSATVIVYRTDRYPLNMNDGTVIYWYNGTACNFAGTNGQKYYFSIFAHDTAMHFAPGVFVAGIPNSYSNVENFTIYEPWIGAAGFTWINPVETGQHDSEILIRRRDRLPVDPADGYDPTSGLWFQYWYNTQAYGEAGLTVGSTYYYGIYGVDTMMNFAGGLAGAFISGNTGLGNVSTVNFIPGYGNISVSWTNPMDPSYVSTLVVKRPDRYPVSPSDGIVVYWNNGSGFLDSGLTTSQKYYYGIFTQDTAGQFSPGMFGAEYAGNYANVNQLVAAGGNRSIILNWQNPNRTDYQATLIVRSLDHVPMDVSDGSNIYWNNGTSFTDSGLTTGQTYYYGVFAHNQFLNFSEGMGIAFTATTSTTVFTSVAIQPEVSKEKQIPGLTSVSGSMGWYDALGDFSQPSKICFWGADGSLEQKDNALILQGDVTKLTLKNALIGKPVKVVVNYQSDQSVKITPVLLVNNEDDTIAAVITPAQSQTVTQNGKQITTSEIQGYGDNDQLQLVIQNPNKSVIKINSIQM